MATVAFDLIELKEQFPELELSTFTLSQLQFIWTEATMIESPDDDNSRFRYEPARGIRDRYIVLSLVFAHILKMDIDSKSGEYTPGTLTSVSEGSVSIGIEPYKASSLNEQYWRQTPYGLRYLRLVRASRLGGHLYVANNYHPWH